MKSIKELKIACKKYPPEYIVYRVWRRVSIYFTWLFVLLGFGPNSVTLLGFFSSLAGGLFFWQKQFTIGILFFLFAHILDDVDGDIARLRQKSSKFGAWLDTATGHLIYPYFWLTLGLGVFLASNRPIFIFFGSLAAVAKLVERSVPSGGVVEGQVGAEQDILAKQKFLGNLKEFLSYMAKNAIVYPVFLVFSLFGRLEWFLMIYVAYLSFFTLGKVLLTGWRIFRYENNQ